MANAGRVAIVPKGEYNSATAYKRLDLVRYNNAVYVAKKANTGVSPTNTDTWMLCIQNVTQEQYDDLISGAVQVESAKEADNSLKLNGLIADEFVTNDDLLINSFFKDPVNTSGKTSWSGTGIQTIDKWILESSNNTANLSDSGLTVTYTGTSAATMLHQKLPYDLAYLKGKTVTVSASVGGTVYSKKFTFPELEGVGYDSDNLTIKTGVYIDFSKAASQTYLPIRVVTTGANTVTIEWIKMEMGSVATPFVPPNKEVEKLKCGIVESNVTMFPPTLSTSILEKALEVGAGVYNYSLNGNSYTGNDLPATNYKFGLATIRKRNDAGIAVILWGSLNINCDFPQVNYYDATNAVWQGWKRLNDGGNADTLDGLHASLFRGRNTNFEYLYKNTGDANDIKTESHYFAFNISNLPSSTLCGGERYGWLDVDVFLGGLFTPSGGKPVVRQTFRPWTTGRILMRYYRTDIDTWTAWENPLDSYLPLTGGTLTGIPVFAGGVGGKEGGEVHFTKPASDTKFTDNIRMDVFGDSIRFFAGHDTTTKSLSFDFNTMTGSHTALHTGNSSKVVQSTSAPSDTSAVWVDTTNKVTKIYKDGAWTALA